jgi:5-formyltetrahydrofolate cyclo-ligase
MLDGGVVPIENHDWKMDFIVTADEILSAGD